MNETLKDLRIIHRALLNIESAVPVEADATFRINGSVLIISLMHKQFMQTAEIDLFIYPNEVEGQLVLFIQEFVRGVEHNYKDDRAKSYRKARHKE